MKIYFIEIIDSFNDVGYAGGIGYCNEQEAEKVIREKYAPLKNIYSCMVQELEIRYAHRNGETEDTTVEGHYHVEWCGEWTIRQNPCQNPDSDTPERYWGPIPEPEEIKQ